jgi:hypothetical protein
VVLEKVAHQADISIMFRIGFLRKIHMYGPLYINKLKILKQPATHAN